MDRYLTRKITIALTLVLTLACLCSCTFGRRAVVEAATSFGEAIKTGSAKEILRLTDGLDRESKNSIKEYLNDENYYDEENTYAHSVFDTIEIEVDEHSVKIDKDKATCDIEITMADVSTLEGGDYDDAEALAQAVRKASTTTTTVTLKFAKVEKEWKVTNIDDKDIQAIFAFRTSMPAIGRSALIEAAKTVADSVIKDDANIALYAAPPSTISFTGELVSDLFNIYSEPTDEEAAFRDTVKNTMSYEIDESSLQLNSRTGSVDILITMADYQALSGKEFKKISDIENAVYNCELMTLKYTAEFVRDGTSWYVTNLDSEEFAAMLSYKHFAISMKKLEGTFKSTLDITDKFVAYVASEFDVSMPDNLEGTINITANLTLKDGKFSVTVDRDAFIRNINSYVDNNIDKILMKKLGTTSSIALDTLAKLGGYADYAALRRDIMNQVTDSVNNIDTSGLESEGTYKVDNDTIIFTSGTDVFYGTVDSYGAITVTSPVKDADAKKLLGSDTVTMTFKQV